MSRRDQRKLARLRARGAESPGSDEQADVGHAAEIPRKPVSRIIELMKFLSSYNNDVGEIEHALANLQEKDQKIMSLATTIRELKRSNNDEIQGLRAEAEEASRRWTELEDDKARLKEDREELKKQKEQEKMKQASFIQQQERKFEKKLEEERDKLVKDNALQIERLRSENTKLNKKIGTLSEEKAQIEKTLKLYVQNCNALESQVDELKLRYPSQSLPIEH